MWYSQLVVRLSFLVILLFSMTVPAVAQSGRVSGQVTDALTGESLPGANVVVAGTNTGSATDVRGQYTLPSVRAGSQTLVVTYIGYRRLEQEVEVEPGATTTANFELMQDAIEGQEIVVSVQAEGQRAAINQQLASNTITNIVSRARIQELPDVNAAESIGRLPGVSIHRSGGEANRISIRGLSPKYNTVSVNGVRVPATGGDDRSVDLSLISSNMLDGIEVMKAITPDQDADAVGGAVDLRLREAPDQLMFDFAAQGGYNELQNYYGNYKFTGSASHRFLSRRLGVIANFNVDGYDRSADKFNANYNQSRNPQTNEQEILITSLNLREEIVDRRRTGASLVLDYRIPHGKIAGNSFYNRLTNDGLYRVNRLFDSGVGRHFYDMQDVNSTTSIMTAALSAEQDFGWVKYDGAISRTRSNSENPQDYLWTFAQEGNAYSPFTRVHGMDPRDVVQYITPDSATTGLSDVNYRRIDRQEDQSNIQLNLTFPFRYGNSLTGYFKTGGKLGWLDRVNDEAQEGRGGMHYGVGEGSGSGNWFRCAADRIPDGFNGYDIYERAINHGLLPIYVFDDNYNRDNFFNGDYPLGYTVNPEYARSMAHALEDCEVFLENVNASRGRDYTGVERFQAGYAMTEINLGRLITFIPGVRWEGDYSRYQGQQYREVVINNQQGAPTDLDTLVVVRENNFWLPMMHLRVRPTNWLDVRLARTETLSRPDFIQYVPISRIDSQQQFAFAGNSGLRPAHSTNYDVALSVYENRIGLFTVAGFHKEVQDHIIWVRMFTTNRESPDPSLNIPESWLNQNPVVDSYINNPFPATYRGFELDWQTNFWYLPSFLQGIVLNLNYTRIFSETEYKSFERERVCIANCGTPREISAFESREVIREGRMVDQPEHIANLTIGYDFRGFSTRLSYLFMTNRANSINATTPVLDTFTGEYSRFDLSVRQRMAAGIELFANFNNLTNTADQNFQGSPTGSPTYTEYYGFTMDVGVRYRF